jgi:hypothetical protein
LGINDQSLGTIVRTDSETDAVFFLQHT